MLDSRSLEIARHYGREATVLKTIQAAGEFSSALSKYHLRSSDLHWNGLVEKAADLQNMLDQLFSLQGLEAAVEQVRKTKLSRMQSRVRLERMGGFND